MTKEVFVLHATQTLELVRSLMRIKHVRHVPIVEPDNTFIGLMTHRDLLSQTISHLAEVDDEEQEYLDRHIHIMNIMKTDVLTADPEMEVCDAITLQYQGGPAYKPQHALDFRSLLFGQDPVAIDRIGATIIEEKRKEMGLPSLKEAGRDPTHIATAAKKGLGASDLDKIEFIKL